MRAKRRRVLKGDEDAEENETNGDDNVVRVDNHCIYFHAEVTRKTVNELIKALRVASVNATRTGHSTIDLFLHSDGGDAFSGLSAMDHVERNMVPVRTIADGCVASAATFKPYQRVRQAAGQAFKKGGAARRHSRAAARAGADDTLAINWRF